MQPSAEHCRVALLVAMRGSNHNACSVLFEPDSAGFAPSTVSTTSFAPSSHSPQNRSLRPRPASPSPRSHTRTHARTHTHTHSLTHSLTHSRTHAHFHACIHARARSTPHIRTYTHAHSAGKGSAGSARGARTPSLRRTAAAVGHVRKPRPAARRARSQVCVARTERRQFLDRVVRDVRALAHCIERLPSREFHCASASDVRLREAHSRPDPDTTVPPSVTSPFFCARARIHARES